MFRAGLNVYSYRSRLGIARSRHLEDGQHMRPRWQLGAKAATLYDICHGPSVDLKMETEIPSEIRRSIDSKHARREVTIRPEVSGRTSLRNSTNERCAPKNQDQKNVREDEF
jgi:hypothetical protein